MDILFKDLARIHVDVDILSRDVLGVVGYEVGYPRLDVALEHFN